MLRRSSSVRIGTTGARLALLPLAALLTSAPASSRAPTRLVADEVMLNARVTTATSPTTFAPAFAVKDGKFLEIGSDEEIRALIGPGTKVIDAGGRLVIPGLDDSHIHPTREGRTYFSELRWDGIPTLAEALRRLREQAKRTPPGQWVRVVGGWSDQQFAEKRLPTLAEINEATGDTPAFVLYLYSRGYLNKAGIARLGLTPSSPAPQGASYETDPQGRLTGLIVADPNPAILYKTIASLPSFTPAEERLSSRHWYAELNRLGVTSVIDAAGGGHPFPVGYAATQSLADADELTVRIDYFLFPPGTGNEADGYRTMLAGHRPHENTDPKLVGGFVLGGGGEVIVDGSLDWENFMAARPRIDEAKFGPELTRTIAQLVSQGYGFRMHATYDESINELLDSVEEVNRTTPFAGRIRWAIDHAETASDATLLRIKRLGGGIAVQDRLAFAGERFRDRYGAEMAAHAPPIRRMLDFGIPVGLGTDGTRAASYNPWVSLYWAVTGRTVGGTQLATPRNRLTRAEALRLYTVGSAWFSGEERIKGEIAAGRLADFAVLDADYFAVPDERIRSITSLLTEVGGRVVHANGPFARFAPPALPPLPDWSPAAHYR